MSRERQGSIQPEQLLDEIRAGRNLRRSIDAGPAATMASPATMARGGLLNEIQKPHELRKVSSKTSMPSATVARGGLLHELKTKRPPMHSAASAATGLASQKANNTASSGAPPSALKPPPVLKAGWLHKRASNGIWQRRFFMLTPPTLYYSSSEPRKGQKTRARDSWWPLRTPLLTADPHAPRSVTGSSPEQMVHDSTMGDVTKRELTAMPMNEVHDVHPMGNAGGEFCLLHLERRLRLRAPSLAEASAWVNAVIGAGLELNQGAQVTGGEEIDRQPRRKP